MKSTVPGTDLPALPPVSPEGPVEVLDQDPITGTPWKTRNFQAFSFAWVVASLFVFVGLQVLFGAVSGKYLLSGFVTMHTRYLIEGLINLLSYYFGGLLVGIISPRVRLLEPAVAAVAAMLACLSVGLMTPMHWFGFSLFKLLVGGGLVFVLAWVGALHGEKVTRQL